MKTVRRRTFSNVYVTFDVTMLLKSVYEKSETIKMTEVKR